MLEISTKKVLPNNTNQRENKIFVRRISLIHHHCILEVLDTQTTHEIKFNFTKKAHRLTVVRCNYEPRAFYLFMFLNPSKTNSQADTADGCANVVRYEYERQVFNSYRCALINYC